LVPALLKLPVDCPSRARRLCQFVRLGVYDHDRGRLVHEHGRCHGGKRSLMVILLTEAWSVRTADQARRDPHHVIPQIAFGDLGDEKRSKVCQFK
jgi:hypothetical protein